MLHIQPEECVDCGACEPTCPVEAISYEDETPQEWTEFRAYNAEFFAELGTPGGASNTAQVHDDHPQVAALPAAR